MAENDPNNDRRQALTATEAAARLGVKRETIYAYVSRGALHRRVDMDGRTSLFDPAEVEALRQGRRAKTDGELHTQIATAITHVTDAALMIRGQDLIALVADAAPFSDVVDVLWESPASDAWPQVTASEAVTADEVRATDAVGTLDDLRITVALASKRDPMRHDLSDASIRSAGRALITGMVTNLPALQPAPDHGEADDPARPLAAAMWTRLTDRPAQPEEVRALDGALSLLVDHGLAGSTFAARIAASVRADPYSVVSAGLGALGGVAHGAASILVHELFAEAERLGDAAIAVGDAQRRLGRIPGFGHTIYTSQDPRFGALMRLIIDAYGPDPRIQHAYRVRDIVAARTDALPNIDLAIGALTWLAGMPAHAGEVIFAIARTAGWLAHAMEEYSEAPLRFRPKARYIGA